MAFEFKLPDIGEGVHEGEIVKWHVKIGELVVADKPMVEVMTDKVTVEITSPVSGQVMALLFNEGDTVNVGQVIIQIDDTADASQAASSLAEAPVEKPVADVKCVTPPKVAAPKPVSQPQSVAVAASTTSSNGAAADGKVLAVPAARNLAKELGVSLAGVSGSGPDGRVRVADVMAQSSVTRATGVAVMEAPKVAPPRFEGDTTLPFKGIRRKISEHLTQSKRTIPHFTYVEEIDMTAVVDARAHLKAKALEQGAKLTYLPFVMKAVLKGLEKYPILNSVLDEANGEIILRGAKNLGVAMATESGLVVPVIHQADGYTLFELAQQVEALSELARTQKLPLDAMQHGTITLTSIGSIGGIMSAPIINAPEVAIIGINKVEKRPVVRDNMVVIRHIMNLSIACDHRVVDGADAAHFVNVVKAALETPFPLFEDVN